MPDLVPTLTKDLKIETKEKLLFLLNSIFENDSTYTERVCNRMVEVDPEFRQICDIPTVLHFLKIGFKESLNWEGLISPDDINRLQKVTNFEISAIESQQLYTEKNKPRASSIFWPCPTRKKYASSRFDTLPYVKNHKLITKQTPIGSAGSCFAIEIAYVLQEQNYNYIVTERADNPEEGVFIKGYTAGDKYASGSFCSGIQFNTGNFLHLAEKAFEIREFKKILIKETEKSGQVIYLDPYREDVSFTSEQAYLANYDKHRNAIRQALETCEVFILTPGLNECWQFSDGTTMARNPRDATYPYATHKIMSVAENVNNIQSFFDIVRKYNPTFKLVLSVSPVPFLATGRAQTHHVIEANCHSKSVLRVAVDELVRNNSDIYYLPSYEYVTYCLKNPWCEDDRHVKRESVQQVIAMFKVMFEKDLKQESDSDHNQFISENAEKQMKQANR